MKDYINLKYKPDGDDLVVQYYLEPNRISLRKAATNVAGESSIDSWSDLKTLSPSVFKRLKPNVFYMNPKTNVVRIAYPQELFEEGNMPQILSSIAGNIFGIKLAKNLRLMDMSFPKRLAKSFPGPLYGIPGVRKMTRIKERFFVGTIIKPKLGLNHKQHAELAYKSWVNGLDVVKDDENLASMRFNGFYERVRETLKMKEKAEDKTGEKKLYMANVTAESKEMLRRAEHVKKQGGEFVMIDILTAGFGALQTLRESGLKLGIHAHRAMHGAFTRNPRHGIAMRALGEVVRMIGVDTLHIGTFGKMEGRPKEILESEMEIESDIIKETPRSLKENWWGKEPVLAVASGGMYPGLLERTFKAMGKEVLYQFGAGVHAHKHGTEAGARAVRQAAEALNRGISLRKAAKTQKELAVALHQWGF